MRVERERQLYSKQGAVKEEATRMEVERQAAAVEIACHIPDWIQIAFRFISDW